MGAPALPTARYQVMPRGSSIELAREMVQEVDKNNDGRVDYAEVRGGGRCGARAWVSQGQGQC